MHIPNRQTPHPPIQRPLRVTFMWGLDCPRSRKQQSTAKKTRLTCTHAHTSFLSRPSRRCRNAPSPRPWFAAKKRGAVWPLFPPLRRSISAIMWGWWLHVSLVWIHRAHSFFLLISMHKMGRGIEGGKEKKDGFFFFLATPVTTAAGLFAGERNGGGQRQGGRKGQKETCMLIFGD